MSILSAVKNIFPSGKKKQEDDLLMGESLDGIDEDFLLNLEKNQQMQGEKSATVTPATTSKPVSISFPQELTWNLEPASFVPDSMPKSESPITVQSADEDGWDIELNFDESSPKKTGLTGLFARFGKKKAENPKKKQRKKQKPKKQKTGSKSSIGKVMLQIILLVVLFFMLGFMSYRVLFPHHAENPQSQVQSRVGNDNKDFEDSFLLRENDSLFQNPFVEIAHLNSTGTDAKGNKVLAMNQSKKPSIPAISNSSGSYQAGVLPAIPGSYPRPNLPAIPQAGSVPAPSTPPATVPQQSASVQGVLTGEDGNNMAIMSDGTVLSEGESYRDGRIAYIGGDGIHFDNGNTIPYGNQ